MATRKSIPAAPAASVNLCPTELKRVKVILSEMSEIADIIRVFSVHLACPPGDEDLVVAMAQAANHLAQQIGWAADLGSEKIGGLVSKGGAEDWLMPPVYPRASEVQHG